MLETLQQCFKFQEPCAKKHTKSKNLREAAAAEVPHGVRLS